MDDNYRGRDGSYSCKKDPTFWFISNGDEFTNGKRGADIFGILGIAGFLTALSLPW
jgi:hypothetical protein